MLPRQIAVERIAATGKNGKGAAIVVVVGLPRFFQRFLDLAPVFAGLCVHYRPCPLRGLRPRRRGRECCPWPWLVVLGGPALWTRPSDPVLALTAIFLLLRKGHLGGVEEGHQRTSGLLGQELAVGGAGRGVSLDQLDQVLLGFVHQETV